MVWNQVNEVESMDDKMFRKRGHYKKQVLTIAIIVGVAAIVLAAVCGSMYWDKKQKEKKRLQEK